MSASIYSLLNPAMNRLLKSPFHRVLSKRIMTVSYTGRKSGKPFQTPVSYYRDGNQVYCFTNGKWRYNFVEPREVQLRLAGKKYQGTASLYAVDDLDRRHRIMMEYYKAVPADRKFYGVGADKVGNPNPNDVLMACHMVDTIKIDLAD